MKKKPVTVKTPKVGDEIYVSSHFSISNGSSDCVGGLAKVVKVSSGISGGDSCLFVDVKEHPGHSYNWSQILSKEQDKLKKEFGKNRAYPDPDIDTPWIEDGDIVNGEVYHGKPIW